ncbi:MAG: hypothetical protein K2Y39_05295 [Candidatus Obscuribacterales bacterium]|nr:hypothetical protein [Candidatus Obscuribacterales bacterium]
MPNRIENTSSNYDRFDSGEESPVHSEVYSDISDRTYSSNKWDTRKDYPQEISLGRLDYGAHGAGPQSIESEQYRWPMDGMAATIEVRRDRENPYQNTPYANSFAPRGSHRASDYGNSDFVYDRGLRERNENTVDLAQTSGNRDEYPFRMTEEEQQERHDRMLRQLLQQVEDGDDAKFAKRVREAGGRQPEISVPEPTSEQREKANQNLDRQNNEIKEIQKSLGDKVTDQQYQDASKLQKAILSGDVNAVQSVMESYRNDSGGLRNVLREAAGLASGDAILNYYKQSDGSMNLSVNTEPTREQPIQPIVSFSNNGTTQPSVSGHATLSSLGPGAQHHVNGALPGDPPVAKALKNIGDAAVLVLAAQRP